MPIVRKTLQSDFEKHRWWFVVNCVLFAFGALLTLLPGRTWSRTSPSGSWDTSCPSAARGRAFEASAWTTASSAPLAELRALAKADRVERRPRVDQVAASLQLEHLTRFFDRVA
jgi:hypothetical protein